MIEPSSLERIEPRFGQPDARGDEIDVEPRLPGPPRPVLQIATRCGLAAREMQLQDAQIGGLGKNALPSRGVQFASRAANSSGFEQ
jgi:hypothetical protein